MPELGCDICREGVYNGTGPKLVTTSSPSELLYRCPICHTWWIGDGHSSHPVDDEEARARFPKEISS
jgi:hypothetical protein